MSICKLQRPLVLALMLAGLSGSVFAVDGIILIDQNRALAGSVTPGDFPGFPISITQPGSYRLSGNITVAANAISAIEISANDVTLDLNGFQIIGPTLSCSPGQPNCRSIGVTTVPSGTFYKGITVRGGTITGFGGQLGLAAASVGQVEDLILLPQPGGNSSFTNEVGPKYVVKHMVSENVFSVQCPGTIVIESVASFYLRQGSSTGCVFSNNTGTVI